MSHVFNVPVHVACPDESSCHLSVFLGIPLYQACLTKSSYHCYCYSNESLVHGHLDMRLYEPCPCRLCSHPCCVLLYEACPSES